MSFDTMKIGELRGIAETFGVDLEGVSGKPAILTRLDEEGVTFDSYVAFQSAEKAEPEDLGHDSARKFGKGGPPTKDDLVLVKMDRNNFTYEAGGYVFTKEHPFVAMTEDEAQHIFDYEDGFRLATPREVKEYYS